VKSRGASKGLVETAFEGRARRAELLGEESTSTSAVAPLRFAAGLYRVQGAIAGSIEAQSAARPLTGSLARDADVVLQEAPRLLHYAVESAPEALAKEARARTQDDASAARSRILVYWDGDVDSPADYLSRAVLRPYVELLSALQISPDRVHRPGRCPFCGGPAWISVRRSDSGMDGARRLLGCALCGGEWQFNRGRCPCCSEEEPKKLPSFQSDAHPSVRIEACETCHRYLKSIDQTLDARSIPEVDDLLSLAMDVWALEEGYTRLEPGLAGI
jgi:formate dehydrogenase maturation protein FdhE